MFRNSFLRCGGNPDQSPIASPLLAPNALLNWLPQIRMFACEIDNLRDHAVLFCDRMLQADTESTLKRVKLFYLKEYIHGFCSLASAGIEDYMKGT